MWKAGVIFGVICIGAFVFGTMMVTPKVCAQDRCGVDEFKQKADSGQYKVINIRTLEEYEAGHLANALQIDYYQTEEFEKYLDSLDKNGKYLIYCRSGNRSGKALEIMKDKGFSNVSDLAGGISAWTQRGLLVVK